MSNWLRSVVDAYQTRDGHRFATCIFPPAGYGPSNPTNIRAALPQDPIADFLVALAEAGPNAGYAALGPIFSNATSIFQRPQAGWFVPSITKLSSALVSAAAEADKASRDTRKKATNEAGRLIAKPFTIASADRGEKRAAAHALASHLCRIYLDTAALNLARNVLKNSQALFQQLSGYPKAEQVTFRYWAGRVLLAGHQVALARDEFKTAFDLCSNRSWSNKRLIFIYLTVCSLILGVFPRPPLLAHFKLDPYFAPLIHAIKCGNYVEWIRVLDDPERREWFRKKRLHILLKDKSIVILWRNLIRHSLLLCRSLTAPDQGPPRMTLHQLLVAFQLSYQDPDFDIFEVEGIFASLVDQGYIRAYILQSSHTLVFSKTVDLGFTKVSAIRIARDE